MADSIQIFLVVGKFELLSGQSHGWPHVNHVPDMAVSFGELFHREGMIRREWQKIVWVVKAGQKHGSEPTGARLGCNRSIQIWMEVSSGGPTEFHCLRKA